MMRTAARHARPSRAAALALALLLAGCAGASLPPPQPAASPAPVADAPADDATEKPPLHLCPTPDTPPPALASRPGYAQYWVTVADASGHPIQDIAQSEFAVTAGGNPRSIEFFREDTGDAPTSLVVLFDASGSMQDKVTISDDTVFEKVRDQVKPAVQAFNPCDEAGELLIGGINAEDSPSRYRVTAVSAALPPATAALLREQESRTPRIRFLQPYTTDHDLALQRIYSNIAFPYGDTPLYDGVLDGIDLLAQAHYPNRALLVVSDGIDTVSAVSREQALGALAASGIPLYAIGAGNPNASRSDVAIAGSREMRRGDTQRLDLDTMRALAAAGGGHLFAAAALESDEGASFVAALSAAEEMIGRGYQVGIVAPPGATVSIAVSGHPGAIVRAELVTTPAADTTPAAAATR